MKEKLIILIIGLFFLAYTLYVNISIFESIPHSQDEVAYLFQAKILKAGSLYLFSLPNNLERFFDHEFIINNGKWYALYTPGHPFLLMIGLLFNHPEIINPLFGFLSILLLFAISKKLFSKTTALISVVLMSLSPFMILITATFMSHAPALFFTLLVINSLTNIYLSRKKSFLNDYLIAGIALGATFLIRPYNALVFFFIYIFFHLWKKPQLRVDHLFFMFTFLIFVSIQFIYNKILTDAFMRFPLAVYSVFNALGFGLRGVEWGLEFAPKNALKNLVEQAISLTQYLFSWPNFWIMMIVGLFSFMSSKKNRSLILFFCFLIQAGFYFFYFHNGIFIGPRYWFEMSWVFFVLAAEGINYLLIIIQQYFVRKLPIKKMVFIIVMLIVVFSFNQNKLFLPAFKGYNGMTKIKLPSFRRPSLVFIPGQLYWQAYGIFFIHQSPILQKNLIIFARDEAMHNVPKNLPPLNNKLLMKYFSNRDYYFYNNGEYIKIN